MSDQGGDFVVASDSFAGRKLRTGVSVDELLDDVARGTVERRLLLIDTCRERLTGGQRGAGEEGADQSAAMAASFAQAMGKARGSVLLAGATQGGYSFDDFERQNGVFTSAILDGLSGKAPADERGWITPRTLASFVEGQVIEWVRQKRPDQAGKSFGILKHFDGPAETLPLAVDPERSRAAEIWRRRRIAALARLKDNQGGLLKGADYDYVESQLPLKEPTPKAMRLLEKVEKLDGSEDRKELLVYMLRDLRGELPASPPPTPETKPPAIQPVAAPPSEVEVPPRQPVKPTRLSGEKASSWRRGVLAAVVGVGVVVVAVALWSWVNGQEKPKPSAQEPVVLSPPSPSVPKAGTVKEGPLGMWFRFIPSGTFTIGSPASEPGRDNNELQHQVQLTRGFWLGGTEVTQDQWRKLVPKNPSYFTACGGNCPVETVSWFDAVAFANKLSEQERLSPCYDLVRCSGVLGESSFKCESATFKGLDCEGYRLPTEAEWEVAARAGTRTALYTGGLTLKGRHDGPELDEIAWYGGNSRVSYIGGIDCSSWKEKQYPSQKACGTQPVGQQTANAWGLDDMLGNVWEWTGTWGAAYSSGLAVDPLGPSEGLNRVLRGGSWNDRASFARAAARLWFMPGLRGNFVGFRLARGQGRSSR